MCSKSFPYGFCGSCALVRVCAVIAGCAWCCTRAARWDSRVGAAELCVCSPLLWKEGHLPVCLLVKHQCESWEQLDPAGRNPVLGQCCWWAAAETQCRLLGANELTFQSCFWPSSSCQSNGMGFPSDLVYILQFWTYTILRFVSKYTICCRYVTALALTAENLPLPSDTLFCRNSGLAHSLLKIENDHFLHTNSFLEKVELEKLHLRSFQYDL